MELPFVIYNKVVITLQNNHALGHNPHRKLCIYASIWAKNVCFSAFFGNSTMSKINSVLIGGGQKKRGKT